VSVDAWGPYGYYSRAGGGLTFRSQGLIRCTEACTVMRTERVSQAIGTLED